MKNVKTTITRAIRRTVKAGYAPVPGAKVTDVSVRLQTNTASYVTFFITRNSDGKAMSVIVGLNDILFDHEFAKRLWGEDDIDRRTGQTHSEHKEATKDDDATSWFSVGPAYKYHIQQMSLLNSIAGRISYIGSTM